MTHETDWVQTAHTVYMEQETLAQYGNEITLKDIIEAGIYSLRATNRWQFVEEECTDSGF